MTSHSQGVDAELAAIMEGDLGEMLRRQLAASNRDFDEREINDALQAACDLAIRKDCHATSTGETYAWLRTTAHRWLGEQRRLRQREIPTDPEAPAFHRPDESTSAETEVLRAEHHQDQATIAGSIVAGLSARQRDVLALHVHGHRRPAVAAALGMTPRQVKRELEAIMRSARSIAGRLLGGGCDQGETIVLRRSCGLAKGREARRAVSHLARCDRCRALADRLDLMRDAPALLPAPAVADQAATGVAADAIDGGLGGVPQHLTDGLAYVKQQAANAYYRVTDPTPLAGTRPGAMAAVVAGCVTLGTSTYCVSNDVNPLISIGLLTPALPDRPPPETRVERVKATPPEPEPVSDPTPAPEVEPDPTPVQPVESEPAPTPEPEPAPEPATPAPVPASGGDSLSGLSGNPTPEPAPAPPPPPTVGGGTGSSGTDFGGL